MSRWLLTALLITLSALLPALAQEDGRTETYRQWIADMKDNPRGPFKRIRWFCEDGSVLPPKPYACGKRGGGFQHGEWTAQTRELREQGYKVANILAGSGIEGQVAEADFTDLYNQILIEKFLVGTDNGWILQKALFYRGAIQEEDEREAVRALLEAMAADPQWIGLRYPALRTGVRLLPHGENTASIQQIRQESASLSDQDAGFKPLRSKIHGAPDGGDAERVREYAAGVSDATLRARYEALASEIDAVYQAAPLPVLLEESAKIFSGGPWLQKLLRDAAEAYQADASATNHYAVSSRLLADLRTSMPKIRSPRARLRVLDLSLAVEAENFRAAAELGAQLDAATRAQRVAWLRAAADAGYGTGVINPREHTQLLASLDRLDADSVSLGLYLQELRYLGRVPGWATQGLRFHFYRSMVKLAEIEPLALVFVQDQLRGGPLLFYSKVLDSLSRDGNSLAGVEHKVFGQTVGVGFRALNPGLARGVLHTSPGIDQLEALEGGGIYLLPETISDLPPVAGILTAGEGNPLSHIQLLARNLGIPNVGVDEELIPSLLPHDNQPIVMAVSPAGLVELEQDSPRWDSVFGEQQMQGAVVIRPDLEKLDLASTAMLPLNQLRAEDSGRVVGPKAAKLGELQHHFPEAVAPGLGIPFGTFRQEVLEQPYKDTGKSVFEWMVDQYNRIQQLAEDSTERKETTEQFREELYQLIANTRLSPQFVSQLRQAMINAFGGLEGYGVFIRSDTNVEDLPGFTGAGLNLTLANVVGFDNVVAGIPKVWASPFTARAFAWRQSHMEDPEHVYPAVLLLKSVANDKSGVMVTQDLDTADRNVLSVAVNEGVGGAVDGQAAESIRINTRDGTVLLLASATAPWRRVPTLKGGVDKLPVSGSDTVLQPAEIDQLIVFAKELPKRFPAVTDDQGNPAPADVEFGFLDGRLQLFQLRPFLESRQARGNAYLAQMDASLAGNMDRSINMKDVPGS